MIFLEAFCPAPTAASPTCGKGVPQRRSSRLDDHFSIDPCWNLLPNAPDRREFTEARELDAPLPWIISMPVSRFLLRNAAAPLKEISTTADMRLPPVRLRYAAENPCFPRTPGLKKARTATPELQARDQLEHQPNLDRTPPAHAAEAAQGDRAPAINSALRQAVRYRVWHTKKRSRLHQPLELQSLLERAMLAPVADGLFSGFHPLPLISFGRALPWRGKPGDGSPSSCANRSPPRSHKRLAPRCSRLRLDSWKKSRQRQIRGSVQKPSLCLRGLDADRRCSWKRGMISRHDSLMFTRETKKVPAPRTSPALSVIEWMSTNALYCDRLVRNLHFAHDARPGHYPWPSSTSLKS